MDKPVLIVIAGPTATGKSALAAELARRIDGEVVSADSMQVYRHMDIGSAKVTREEMLGVPHHMIDVAEPTEEMDVSRYAKEAKACIEDIRERGRVPILCGGTGFYIQAVTRDIDFTETTQDTAFREECRLYAETNGPEALHRRLAALDPEAAAQIHPNNIRRVTRALEYYRETGEPISRHNEIEKQKKSPYHLIFFGLTDEREALYARIDSRVDFMLASGLMDEVRYLKAMGLTREHVSMQGIGYKEMLDAIDGRITEEEAVRLIKRNSRHYAKRQMTYFRREDGVIWLSRADYGGDDAAILAAVIAVVQKETGIKAKKVSNPYA